jgi:hypothetical protein
MPAIVAGAPVVGKADLLRGRDAEHGTLRLMTASRWGSIAALLGGVAWVVSAILGWGGEQEQTSYLVGLALVVVALAFGGYSLVATAPVWLRAVVSLATPALGYTVWLTVMDSVTPGYLPVLIGGVVLVVAGGIGLGRGAQRNDRPEPPPTRGRRAAR